MEKGENNKCLNNGVSYLNHILDEIDSLLVEKNSLYFKFQFIGLVSCFTEYVFETFNQIEKWYNNASDIPKVTWLNSLVIDVTRIE